MYETMAKELKCESYRKLPVLSVSAGYRKGITQAQKDPQLSSILPAWLDGEEYGRISPLGFGDDTAQITPKEFVDKMLADAPEIEVVLGSCTGIESDQGSERGNRKIVGVKYVPRGDQSFEEQVLPADAVVVSAGPWSCAAEDWFQGAVQLPMEGIKSTSIVWKKPEGEDVDATALFCGEDDRFSTHCK
jgi:glycine/D-amino acid oxidase-like deaminating enzyme